MKESSAMRCESCGEQLPPGQLECGHGRSRNVQAPPADPNIRLVTVVTAGDPALIALARSLLDAEGIEYALNYDDVQDLFGWGRVGAHFNVVTGPAAFVVREEDAPRAGELLRELASTTVETDSDTDAEP